MAICNNTLFDLLRNSFLIPYRFNADGKTNPVIMTDDNGQLLPEYETSIWEKEYRHFHKIYQTLGNNKNIYLARAYRYSHDYAANDMKPEQKILEKSDGVLLIRELPDTVKQKGDRGRSIFCCMESYDRTGKGASYVLHFLRAGFSGEK